MKLIPLPLASLMLLCVAASSPASAEITFEDCRISAGQGAPGIKARCGTLERHEDPSDPASPLLALSVAVVPALSLEPEPPCPALMRQSSSVISALAGDEAATQRSMRLASGSGISFTPPITMTSNLVFMALVNICAMRGRPF